MKRLNERDWVKRLQQGDQAAFEPLYNTYIAHAVRVAYLITESQQASEDAVQDTFVQVMRNIGSLRDTSRFRSWFFSILLNTARRYRRRSLSEWLRLDQRAQPSGSEDMTVHTERTLEVRAAISRLPDRHRFPLILRYYVDMGEAEIAQALGIPAGTVKSRLYHARQKLRGDLQGGAARDQ